MCLPANSAAEFARSRLMTECAQCGEQMSGACGTGGIGVRYAFETTVSYAADLAMV